MCIQLPENKFSLNVILGRSTVQGKLFTLIVTLQSSTKVLVLTEVKEAFSQNNCWYHIWQLPV